MKTRSAMALHYKAMSFALFKFRRGLRSFLKAPLTFVFFESHKEILNPFKRQWAECVTKRNDRLSR
jgi:hypothetical protein